MDFSFLEMKQNFHNLEIYQISFRLFLKTHKISQALPKHETYELGSQLRRSSDSIVSNIVEGHGRKMYKHEFIRFIIFSHASCLETICHLEKIHNLYPTLTTETEGLIKEYLELGKKLINFLAYYKNKAESTT
jgi:four helix bundle protein